MMTDSNHHQHGGNAVSHKVGLVIIGVVVLMMSMMAVGFYVLWDKMSVTLAQVQTVDRADPHSAVREQKPAHLPLHKLDTIIVNLADPGGRRYLRVTMELELKTPELAAEIDQRLPQVRDSILMILPTKAYAQISTSEGKIQLRDEIIAKLNSFLRTGAINAVYFTEFVVQ